MCTPSTYPVEWRESHAYLGSSKPFLHDQKFSAVDITETNGMNSPGEDGVSVHRRSSVPITMSNGNEVPVSKSIAGEQRPTYVGLIKTPEDAVLLLAACDLPTPPANTAPDSIPPRRITRRLLDDERAVLIAPGSVFVWDEGEAGMRRWTDGRCWSASRVSGSFLTYRELEVRKKSSVAGDGPRSNLYKCDGLVKQSFSITTASRRKLHVISYYRKSDLRNSHLRRVSEDPRFFAQTDGPWAVKIDQKEYGDIIMHGCAVSSENATAPSSEGSPVHENAKIRTPPIKSAPVSTKASPNLPRMTPHDITFSHSSRVPFLKLNDRISPVFDCDDMPSKRYRYSDFSASSSRSAVSYQQNHGYVHKLPGYYSVEDNHCSRQMPTPSLIPMYSSMSSHSYIPRKHLDGADRSKLESDSVEALMSLRTASKQNSPPSDLGRGKFPVSMRPFSRFPLTGTPVSTTDRDVLEKLTVRV